MLTVSPPPKLAFLGNDGLPLVGGKLWTFVAGTTTPLNTYTDSSGLVLNTNPVILDVRGEAQVWTPESLYKYVLTDPLDVEIYTVDNIAGAYQGIGDLYLDIPRNDTGWARGQCFASSANTTFGPSALGPIQAGWTFSVINISAVPISIFQDSGTVLHLAGAALTGTRTLLAGGMATVWCADPTTYYITGAGIS